MVAVNGIQGDGLHVDKEFVGAGGGGLSVGKGEGRVFRGEDSGEVMIWGDSCGVVDTRGHGG